MADDDSLDPAADPAPVSFPEAIGPYRLIRRLGQGAFAEVFLAYDPENASEVALKVLKDNLDPRIARQIRTRFFLEERIARAIDDERIVRLLATSALGEEPCFIAMEYVDGLPFTEWFRRLRGMKSSALDVHLAELARLGHEVAIAMAKAHARGIVHRDLKPDNVLITGRWASPRQTSVKILDFGIAKAPAELLSSPHSPLLTPHHTELGTVMGSPPYMAPEQNGGAHAVTGKADVFALGAMLTITALGLDAEALEIGGATLATPDDVARVFEQGPPLPDAWRALLTRMLREVPSARPEMRDVAIELQRLAQLDEAFATAVHAWIRRRKLPSRKRLAELLSRTRDERWLTEDERAFLHEAPARLLARRRPLLGVVALGALAVVAALSVRWSRDRERFGYVEARLRAEKADALRREADLARQLTAERSARESHAASADDANEGDAPAVVKVRELRDDERAASCRSLVNAAVTECNEQRLRAERSAASLTAQLDNLGRELDSERRTLDDRTAGEARCLRELEGHKSELNESRSRLHLCADSLRRTLERLDRPAADVPADDTGSSEPSALDQ